MEKKNALAIMAKMLMAAGLITVLIFISTAGSSKRDSLAQVNITAPYDSSNHSIQKVFFQEEMSARAIDSLLVANENNVLEARVVIGANASDFSLRSKPIKITKIKDGYFLVKIYLSEGRGVSSKYECEGKAVDVLHRSCKRLADNLELSKYSIASMDVQIKGK